MVALAVVAAAVVGCSSAGGDDATASDDLTKVRGGRAAILEIDEADHVYALSDPHGGYETLVKLLAANELIDRADDEPTKPKWTGGAAILVIAGDLIDKGAKSLEVIDLVRSLEAQAPGTGGRVVATMGNHEAEFLQDPHNDKAMSTGKDAIGINEELEARGIDAKKLAAGKDDEGRGRWLASLPFGVRVKKWFFAHSGNTQKMSIKELNKKLADSLANNGWADKDITGKDSILEAEEWYGDPKDGNAGEKEADALGVKHIVFGHDPGAFNEHGKLLQSKNGILVKINVEMGLHQGSGISEGAILHVTTKGDDTVEVLDARGKSSELSSL